jgi:hypothetical protein
MGDDIRYYFCHIPKTAGCTMAYRLLPKFFDHSEICPHTRFDTLLAASAAERRQYRLFHGHFNDHLRHFVPGPLRVLTLLRHPFERAISQYRYILSSPDHPLHQQVAAQPDFGAYLRDRRLFAPNSLTLALGSELDSETVLRRARWRGAATDSLDALLDEETFNTSARERHEIAAMAMLDRCTLVGLQEEMSRTAFLLHDLFGRGFSGPVEVLNETRAPPLGRDDLPADVLEDLAARHEHDLAVYAHGRALFERHWARASGAAPKPAATGPVILRGAAPVPQRLYYMTLPWSGDVDLASELLQGYWRPSEICPAWNYDGLFALPAAALRDYSAFHGYFFWPLEHFIGAAVAPITFLTDPVERAARQYRERLADRGHRLHPRVRAKGGLGDFVCDPVAFTPDVLTLSLARRFSPADMRRLADDARRLEISVNDALGEYVAARPATRRDLARAKRRLEQCWFIGFAETLDASLDALGRLLDWPGIGLALNPRTRQSFGTRTKVAAEDRARIRAINPLDTELYDFALALTRRARPASRFSFQRTLGRLRELVRDRPRALGQGDD